MERKIGEEFDYNGQKLKVLETAMGTCAGCVFMDNCHDNESVAGACNANVRADKRQVVFVEVAQASNEEPQKQELNLCEVLKDCPRKTKFWSKIHGDVFFEEILNDDKIAIKVVAYNKYGQQNTVCFSSKGYFDEKYDNAEIVLVPSKTQQDWSKWKCPKPKFDPKTLQPFDRVLARIGGGDAYCWFADFVSVPALEGDTIVCIIGDRDASMIIPYNDDTKHLVGTSDEAPEFYRYWEE